jgi:hypothetical protein
MTEKDETLFKEILELNWEIVNEADPMVMKEKIPILNEKIDQLREQMGAEEYDEFIKITRKSLNIK